jgi:hypothetical protein
VSAAESPGIDELVNLDRYPLGDPDSPAWHDLVARTRNELADVGCSVLPDFVLAEQHEKLRRECAELAPDAYYRVETVNTYNIAVDAQLPDDHPGRVTMERGNAFVARDRIPPDSVIHGLYTSDEFKRFVASCFGLPQLYELADPLSGLTLNVITPGKQHPWHFDTNEFTVSMLTQQPEQGGEFQYCPNIRTAESENFADVRAVLDGRGEHLVRTLQLRPGDLQLFQGRYALHQVSEVRGEQARHSAIFAYSERPGVIGSVSRTRQLFGRVRPEHLAAAGAVRVDRLLD